MNGGRGPERERGATIPAPTAGSIRISPGATVLPANTLRFYIHFSTPGEAHFDRHFLWLLDEENRVVPDPFLVLSQELWSADGDRLTILMEPRRIKRGLGGDRSHEAALVVGRTYTLAITALGHAARHTFSVSEPESQAVDETRWSLDSPIAGSLDPLVVNFDRVMDAALCEDEIAVLTASGEFVETRVSLAADGTTARLVPGHPWRVGEHRLVVSDRFEDVCGNRLGEALDHETGTSGRPRQAAISFTTRDQHRSDRYPHTGQKRLEVTQWQHSLLPTKASFSPTSSSQPTLTGQHGSTRT